MNVSNILARQGHRLLQISVVLFLFTSFEGFTIPYFASPMVGRSVHTLSALFGLMLVAFGLLLATITDEQLAEWEPARRFIAASPKASS